MMIDDNKRYTGPEHREIRTAYEHAYSRANRQKLNAVARRRRALGPKTTTPGKNRRALLRRYGLTEEDFDRMSAGQDHVCALCRKAPRDRLCVDHCHDFRMLRSLLCRGCNRGLGNFGDNPALLRAGADYLEIWRIIHARRGPPAKPIRIKPSKPKKRKDTTCPPTSSRPNSSRPKKPKPRD